MTPKEKALELANKFYQGHFKRQPPASNRKIRNKAIKYALICVSVLENNIAEYHNKEYLDEVIKELNEL